MQLFENSRLKPQRLLPSSFTGTGMTLTGIKLTGMTPTVTLTSRNGELVMEIPVIRG